MTLEQRADLVLAFAKVLYVNGQATEQTVDATERLGRALGVRVTIVPHWGDLRRLPHFMARPTPAIMRVMSSVGTSCR
jgi:hypothetical protein